MSIFWVDGFEGYGTSGAAAGVAAKYTGPNTAIVSGVNVVSGRVQGHALDLPHDNRVQTGDIMTAPEVTLGFWFRQTAFSTTTDFIASLWKVSGVANGAASITQNSGGGIATGSWFLRLGVTNVGSATGFAPVLNQWYMVHLYSLIHTSGLIKAFVDGAQIAEFAGDTTGSGANWNYAGWHAFNRRYEIDSAYVASGLNNLRSEVYTLFPTGAGSEADFTPNTGTNAAAVDDSGPDDDATYNESNSAGNRDLFPVTVLPSVASISAIQHNLRSKATSASHNIRPLIRSGMAEQLSANVAVGTAAYAAQYMVSETDPDTTDPWETAGVNAAEFGYQDGGAV